ncbi:UNVERIFIED_ORG: hypothetical protein QOE_2517, partial [Clostridioides difficile F501]
MQLALAHGTYFAGLSASPSCRRLKRWYASTPAATAATATANT